MSLTSINPNWEGGVCNGVTLGSPATETINDLLYYVWDDSAFPTGEINDDGDVIGEGDDGQPTVVGHVTKGE